MEIKVYTGEPPQEARDIREDVFVREQGFDDEFDEIDSLSTHIVLFDNGTAVGTCRFFTGDSPKDYIMGRLAVRKEWRGRKIGAALVAAAEREILSRKGKIVHLHAQVQAIPFYGKQGYISYGPTEPEQGCPHIWMKKEL